MEQAGFAFAMTLIAGLSTGIGSLLALLTKKTNARFLAVSLGFSAGVMIYVSMVELFTGANEALTLYLGERKGSLVTVIAFFGGMLFISLIDKVIPGEQNPHEIKKLAKQKANGAKVLSEGYADIWAEENTMVDSETRKNKGSKAIHGEESQEAESLMRTGVFMALALAIHNFPEGMATFISALQDLSIAIPVVVAIAIHNIPEGIAVSVPIYFATGNRRKAFWYSFFSGLAEPLGAVVGFLILMPFLNDLIFGIIYAGIAGIMVFISFDELLPAAREYGEHHLSVYGLVAGMMVMAVSLLLFL